MSTNGILDFQNTNKIIFRGSDSNVVIDTSNVSLGIGIQGTETPGSNLHVVGDAYISSNLKLTTDTSILVNSNVVADFTGPHGRGVAKLGMRVQGCRGSWGRLRGDDRDDVRGDGSRHA